jgi:hypothetical protein
VSVSLEALLNDGWAYHDTESERLARELEAAVATAIANDRLVAFVHLSTHTIGEHLGDWARALKLGKRVLTGRSPEAANGRAWGWLFVAATLAGDCVAAADAELCYLKVAGDDVRSVLLDMRFMLVVALVSARRPDESARLYRSALDFVAQNRSPAALDRTIAVASNNLGWELFEKADRTVDEDDLMQLAAETSLASWQRCGDWINKERALYLAARVANASGNPNAALRHAGDAIAIINANGARPLDEALLQLTRATSLKMLEDPAAIAAAIRLADAAAARLTAPNLKAQYANERAKIASSPEA